MGKLADQATQIKAILDGVGDIGVTFDHQPLPRNDWAAFIESFTTVLAGKRVVRAWTVQYLGEVRVDRAIARAGAGGGAKTIRGIRWVIRGHMSWDDPTSEAIFRDLVELVVTRLDERRSLNGTALDHDPCDVDMPNNGAGVFLGDVLCHFAEISMTAKAEQTLVVT